MKNFLWALVVVVILGGGYLLWQSSTAPSAAPSPAPSPASPSGTPTPSPTTPTPSTGSGQATPTPSAPMTATVTYNGSSFSPSEVTIKKGGIVTWKNTSGSNMWVASAQHPSHMVYDGTSRQEHCPDTAGTAFDQCAGGGDFSFTFQKTGTWNYHDHINSTVFGKVVVVD